MSQRVSLLVCITVMVVGCDAAPDVERAHIAREHGVVAATGPSVAPPDPDPVEPDPVEPDPDPVVSDPDPQPDPVEPDPDPAEPDPVEPSDDDLVVDAFPFIDQNDTAAGTRAFDHYACAPATREGGPEVVYRVSLPVAGMLVASVDDLPAGVDVDVHILEARDAASCIDRGNTNAAAWLEAGDYIVVADSWVDASGAEKSGPYTLTLGFTTPDDFVADGLDADLLATALDVFDRAWAAGETDRLEYTVIDFSRYSGTPRLWTIDLHDGSLAFVEHVTHGAGSADPARPGYAKSFSNDEGSHQSSLGLMRTSTRYISGENGLSLRLDGLEPGINDAVRARAIVIHSDAYASADYLAAHGYLGNSWGCQVIDPMDIDDFVSTLEGGALVWSWFPDASFLGASSYLD